MTTFVITPPPFRKAASLPTLPFLWWRETAASFFQLCGKKRKAVDCTSYWVGGRPGWQPTSFWPPRRPIGSESTTTLTHYAKSAPGFHHAQSPPHQQFPSQLFFAVPAVNVYWQNRTLVAEWNQNVPGRRWQLLARPNMGDLSGPTESPQRRLKEETSLLFRSYKKIHFVLVTLCQTFRDKHKVVAEAKRKSVMLRNEQFRTSESSSSLVLKFDK